MRMSDIPVLAERLDSVRHLALQFMALGRAQPACAIAT
jgi:hypothetical protein